MHIKLGLLKQFFEALNRNSEAFKNLQNFFSTLSEAKIKPDVFIGPQIRITLECIEFLTINKRKSSLE